MITQIRAVEGSMGRVVFTNRGLPAVLAMKFALKADAVWFVAPANSGRTRCGVLA
jgi:hypothetical protein